MKKIWMFAFLGTLLFASGCGNNPDSKEEKATAVEEVLQEGISKQEAEVVIESEEVQMDDQEEEVEIEGAEAEFIEISESLSNEAAVEIQPEPLIEEVVPEERKIDVDLTKLSSIMVYAEVFNIVMNPEEYDGKTIKMTGPCFIYENPDTGEQFYATIIQDATACCAQGLEFYLMDGIAYPEVDEIITVVGEVEAYEDFGMMFCRIINAELVN